MAQTQTTLMRNLVIVESPTKARTLTKFLGDGYQIEASMGHIRDLPKADLGIDIVHNFEPQYIIPRDKKKRVGELKKLAQNADTIWLASDPDREGEAIAWHIAHIFNEVKKKPELKRVTFHEITEHAIQDAFKHPRAIDTQLVDAQQARRVLDRLVGYKLSPLLWKKVKRGLSAGRVQSVAVRLIVEREKEIQAFKAVEYWSIEALLEAAEEAGKKFMAQLTELNGKKLEIGTEKVAQEHLENLKAATYRVAQVTKKQVRRLPSPPFTTSTMQQMASNRLGFTAKRTMAAAQFLYERGLITYMRTDSLNLSPIALAQSRDYIKQAYGEKYLPSTSRVFKTKSKSAQEAHEAIRPTHMPTTADKLQVEGLTRDHVRLYELIWKRMIASQMAEALVDQTAIDVEAKKEPHTYTLHATGSVVNFDGWMKLYLQPTTKKSVSAEGDEIEDDQEKTQLLPELSDGEKLKLLDIKGEQHFTEPPPRFNEASLIKKLEELGIGRPSTYAPTISTIMDRFYVEKQERKLVPTALGMAVTEFLLKNFADIIDYSFTAKMEDELDQIAEGKEAWQPVIRDFYEPFEKRLEKTEDSAKKVELVTEKVDKNCPECGKPLLVRYGKFGKFLACSGFPDCKHTEALEEAITTPCPKCGGQIVQRRTKTGKPFYGCKNYPNCDFASWTKPGEEKPKEQTKEPENLTIS